MKRTKDLRKLNKILRRVRSFESAMREHSDEELAHLTVEFKERLQGGESLDDILPEAFAAI